MSATEGNISRRDFARTVAVAAATAAIVPAAFAQAEKTTPAPTKPPGPPEPELAAQAQAEAEAAYQNILRKYGSRFSDEQKADIRRLALQQQKSLESLRAFKLQNSDEPATVLHVDMRKDD
jgi:predicted component of type VI protein secretion system